MKLLAFVSGLLSPADPARVPPDTLSPAFRAAWPMITGRGNGGDAGPPITDLAAWKRRQDVIDAGLTKLGEGAVKAYKVEAVPTILGGVPVLTVTPQGWKDDGRLLIYVHGGAFTSFSARSTLFSSALMANRTGLRVISVDYTLAPQQRWQATTDQVVSVYRTLLKQGRRAASIGIFGDSAGGSIAAGSVLKLRDQGVRMPGAVILWSPWSDVTFTGDTYRTLADYDPLLNSRGLGPAAAAYADPADQKNPYVSPVYGDYAKGFPPTLIQGGTREIFLSNMVRHYQALATAGVPVVLDLYEGMIHVFQPMAPAAPESIQAMKRVVGFWNEHLARR
jgi:acetyl esterase/lipase